MFGDDPEASANTCSACRETAGDWSARPDTRFPVEKDWCWRAAEARNAGLPAPEDPRACLSPCPRVTKRCEEIIEIVSIAGRQLRVGFGGAYALDWSIVARIADDSAIETDGDWWRLVSVVEGELVRALNPPKPGNEGSEGA